MHIIIKFQQSPVTHQNHEKNLEKRASYLLLFHGWSLSNRSRDQVLKIAHLKQNIAYLVSMYA